MKRAFIAGILCISLLISSGGTALAAESSDRYDAADFSKPYRAEDFSAKGSYAQQRNGSEAGPDAGHRHFYSLEHYGSG